MLKQKLNTSQVRADQVASRKIQTLKLGLDVHADTIVVVRILENSAPPPAQKFTPAKFLAWIKSQLPLAEQGHSCYEAGPFGSAFSGPGRVNAELQTPGSSSGGRRPGEGRRGKPILSKTSFQK